MASYTVNYGELAAHAKTMVAATVDTVTFAAGDPSSPGWGKMPAAIEVLSSGASDIYFTVDGSTPTVAGATTYRVPNVAGATKKVKLNDGNAYDAVVVKLISAGTPVYSVSRAD